MVPSCICDIHKHFPRARDHVKRELCHRPPNVNKNDKKLKARHAVGVGVTSSEKHLLMIMIDFCEGNALPAQTLSVTLLERIFGLVDEVPHMEIERKRENESKPGRKKNC